jgi:hypothetical protein
MIQAERMGAIEKLAKSLRVIPSESALATPSMSETNEHTDAEVVATTAADLDGSVTADRALPSKSEPKATAPVHDVEAEMLAAHGAMQIGECKFGITCTGEPLGSTHWLADSAVCGDMVMALPSSVLVAGRTKQAKGVAVDMAIFLDSVLEGAARLKGMDGIIEVSRLPGWAVARLMGTFPAIRLVYNEAMDQVPMAVEAAAMKAAIGMKVTNTRHRVKTNADGTTEVNEEVLKKEIAPDPALSKFILSNRMKSRYNDDGEVKQAVQINLIGAEADL